MSDQQELIPMRPGDLLRQVREQRKISLERAAEASRIRLRVLAAIESGETETIPTVYLRGYVRNYARFLGVDPADIESRMDALQGTEPEVRTVFPDQAPGQAQLVRLQLDQLRDPQARRIQHLEHSPVAQTLGGVQGGQVEESNSRVRCLFDFVPGRRRLFHRR